MTRQRTATLALIALLGAALAACTEQPEQPDLQSTSWVLDSLGPAGEPHAALPSVEVTLMFDAGEASGFAGCNAYSGSYEAETDGTFSIGVLFHTDMACVEPGVSEQEQQYVDILKNAESYEASDTTLIIRSGQDELLFTAA